MAGLLPDRQASAQPRVLVGVSIGASAPVPEGPCDTLRQPLQIRAREGVSVLLGLGIDIGGTKIAVALGDADGHVRARCRLASESQGSAEADVARIADAARGVLAEAGVSPRDVAALGISAPGPVDAEAGVLLDPPNLPGWGRVPLVAWLGDALGLPAVIENDANAAALAEWRFGAGRGCRDLVYLTMSTGIGGGLILGGRLHRGLGGGAGEVGHIPLEAAGEPCACGLRGCFEAYAGGAAWAARLRRIASEGSAVVELAGSRDAVTPRHVVEAARQGDAFALGELDRFNDYVARGVAILVFTLAPERVVLGTIPTAAPEELCLAPIRARVAARVWPRFSEGLSITGSALGEDLAFLAGIGVAFEHAAAAAP
jgi:glucokinase